MQNPDGFCKWEISFSIIDSKYGGKQLLYDSTPLPVTLQTTSFKWPSLNLTIPNMSILDRNAFTIMINLHPIDQQTGNRGRILWFTCIVQYTSMVFHLSQNDEKTFDLTYDYSPNTCLSMTYSGILCYDGDYGRFAQFTLQQLEVQVVPCDLQELIEKQARQALVLVSEMHWRDEQTGRMLKSPISYLNRANEIRSTNGKDRLYIWHLKDDAASFPGFKRKTERDWQNQLQEYEDLVKLCLIAPLSLKRDANKAQYKPLPDHEAVQTQHAVCVPIRVCPGQTVVLKLFNLFDEKDPSQSCEVHVKWNDYISAACVSKSMKKSEFKRFSLNALYKRAKEEKRQQQQQLFRSSFIVYPGFTVEIDYKHVCESQIEIVTVYAHVQDYHFTISKLGHYVPVTA